MSAGTERGDGDDGGEERFGRARVVCIYDRGEETTIIAASGEARRLEGPSARLVRAVLEYTLTPRTRGELLAELARRCGGPIDDPRVIDELLALLREFKVLVPAAELTPRPRPSGRVRVVLGLTGAIGTMHTPNLVAHLQARGFSVRVAATPSALRFVGAEALAALTHHPVIDDLFAGDPRLPVPHIDLARWADAVLICPASATTVARLCAGDYSTVVSATALVHRGPTIVAPSMNLAMFESPAVRRNLEQLADDGMLVVHPATGVEVADAPETRVPGIGPAPPPAVLARVLEAALAEAPAAGDPRRHWERLYRETPVEQLPWFAEEIDEDIAAALDRVAPAPASVLDIGTGPGQLARAAAARGHRVVATDLSRTALARARAREGSRGITWLVDDITRTDLEDRFDVILDRGCLHVLDPAGAAAYARAVARLSAPDAALIVKVHDREASRARGTRWLDEDAIRGLFSGGFTLVEALETRFADPERPVGARLYVLRRGDGR